MSLIADETMTTVDLPKSIVFYAVVLGLRADVRALRSGRLVENWRRGYSVLERPEAFDTSSEA